MQGRDLLYALVVACSTIFSSAALADTTPLEKHLAECASKGFTLPKPRPNLAELPVFLDPAYVRSEHARFRCDAMDLTNAPKELDGSIYERAYAAMLCESIPTCSLRRARSCRWRVCGS
jgi:hypothetical protein